MAEGFYYVKNWWKFQHYRDRRPPWIKLHRGFFTDPAVQSLTILDRYHLLELWAAASDLEGSLPLATGQLAACCHLANHQQAACLLARLGSKGLISKEDTRGARRVPASKLLAPKTEAYKEETEKKKQHPLPPLKKEGFVLPEWIPGKTWQDFLETRAKIRKAPTTRAKELLVKKLEKLQAEGFSVVEVLEQSILKGWQDVFPVKLSGGLFNASKRELSPEDIEALDDLARAGKQHG